MVKASPSNAGGKGSIPNITSKEKYNCKHIIHSS